MRNAAINTAECSNKQIMRNAAIKNGKLVVLTTSILFGITIVDLNHQ